MPKIKSICVIGTHLPVGGIIIILFFATDLTQSSHTGGQAVILRALVLSLHTLALTANRPVVTMRRSNLTWRSFYNVGLTTARTG
jgi:hypothetical protein